MAMATVTYTSDSSGNAGMSVCTFTGDGNALVINPGFKPRFILYMNVTDGILDLWVDGMASTLGTVNIAANGTISILTAANGITVPAPTYTSPGDGINGALVAAALVVNTKVYRVAMIR